MKIGKFQVGEYVVKDVGGKKHLVFDCKNCVYGSSLADDPACRFHILTIQQEAEADLLVLADVYERVYDEQQTLLMKDISQLSKRFETESVWSYAHLGTNDPDCEPQFGGRHDVIVRVAHDLVGSDPVLAYLTLLQEIKKEADRMAGLGEKAKACSQVYLDTLLYLKKRFEDTLLVAKTKEYLTKLRTIPDTKEIYKSLLEAQIKPAFIGSRLLFGETEELELLDEYQIGRASVQIFSHPNKTEKLYFLNPPEYTLPPDKYFVLSKTKEVVASYKPGSTSLSGIAKSRKYFERVYESTIVDIAQANKIFLAPDEARELAEIVARYTVGYGMLELILGDKRLTDIFVDSPIGMKPLYVVHSDFGQCQTNILYTEEEASSLVSKMRAMSGRPFDEAHPVLDFDLPDLETRVAVIGKPLAPDGIAFAFRLHKVTPWTLPQFIDNKFINPLGAGLLSFFIDQQATMLVTGSRGSGKCVDENSLLQLGNGQTVKIKKIVDSVIEKAQQKIELSDGVCIDLGENGIKLETVTLAPDLKTNIAPISKVWRRNAPKQMLSVTLRSGKNIVTTPEHPFFLTQNGRIVQKRADELTINDFIATPRTIPIKQEITYSVEWFQNNRSFNPKLGGIDKVIQESLCAYSKTGILTELAAKTGVAYKTILNIKNGVRKTIYFNELKGISNEIRLDPASLLEEAPYWTFGTTSHKINPRFFLEPINEKAARFLGLLFGDGHVDAHEVSLTNTNMGILEEFKELCQELFGVAAYIRFPKNRSSHCVITSKGLSSLLSLRFNIPIGKKADSQEMPTEIATAAGPVLSEFLRAYFDCDASVDVQKRLVELSTASKKMALDTQNALHRFGIISFLRKKIVKGKDYYILTMAGENAYVFSQKIGFDLNAKKEKLELAFSKKEFNTNIDVIPNCLATLQTIQKNHGLFTARRVTLDQKNISRAKLQRLISDLGSELTEISNLKKLAWSNIFWDEVYEVKKIDYDKKFVYDLTIEHTHNFVVNGVIAHNTSLLQAMMLEILQNARIITQEDSVTGDSRILVERNGKKESTTVGELIDDLIQKHGHIDVNSVELLDANPENVRVFSLDKNGKTTLSRVSQFSRHTVSKDIFKVTTASGKKLKVTVDHSLFGLNSEGRMVPVRTGDLKIGNSIATISGLPITSQETEALFNSSASSFSTSGTTVFVEKEKQFLNPKLAWDEVVKIEKLEPGVHTVYDFSVPECENFVCENILAHNTLELPVEYMKNVGFNIQRLKTRSPISVSKSETEVSPAESLRTALRLGDSALVIGEVRSREAKVLYEAMRVGAAGNIVLGTIHGDSAYSVWDRVVNDLQVPTTSFKATDAVIVARPIRFAGSLKRARRVVEITEVKKHWTQDPDQEAGLLDLMMYTAKDDKLVFQEDALKDSELFQKISRTSGLNMNEMWTAIKSNASAKAFLVDLKNKYGLPLLLEAENYAKCNNKFMLLREQQLEMHKTVDYDELLGKWKFWVQNSMVKRLLDQKSRQKK